MDPITTILYTKNQTLFDDLKNISYANIKGESLSWLAYGRFGKRIFGDIDILIPKSYLIELDKILNKNGYVKVTDDKFKNTFMKINTHQIVPYCKKIGFVSSYIDVNTSLFWGEYTGKRVDISDFLSDTIEMNIYGCKVKTLPPLIAMVQLILHHYKDMNSIFLLATRKNINQNMFKDVYHLLKNNLDSIPLDKLYNMSLEYEIIPFVYYILYYTGLIYKDEILEKYTATFKTPEGEALLNCYGLNEAERREWKYDFQARLESENLYDLIKDDLTEKDLGKIEINKKVF